jgi:hypothetical protein
MTFTAAVYRDSSHSAIVVDRTEAHTYFIPLATLKVEKLSNKTFDADWAVYPEYPVRRAAEVYLGAGQYRTIPVQVREHLTRIVADPATVYPTFESTQGKSKMASKAPAPRNGINSVVESSKKPVKAAAAPVADKKPVAAAKPPVKAAAPAAKSAPVKAAAPAKAAPVAAKAPAKAAAVEGAKPGRTRLPDGVKYKVADTSRVKRGFLLEFVEKAQGMKVFTREQLEAAFATREADDTKTYFPYAVGKGIFEAA